MRDIAGDHSDILYVGEGIALDQRRSFFQADASGDLLFKRRGTQILKIVSGGIEVAGTITPTGQTLFADGTAAAPGLAPASDPDSGIFSAAANILGFAVAGAEAARLAAGASTFSLGNAAAAGFIETFRHARGTVAAPTVITTADELGVINFEGYSGAGGYVIGAAIKAISEGTIATTRVAGHLSFWTGTDAAPTVLTERMRIDSAGLAGFGTTSPAVAQVSIFSKQGTGTASLRLTDSETNGASKYGIIVNRHATNASADFVIIAGGGEATNRIDVGGGHATYNAAQKISFYSAANSTTTSGTERMSIANSEMVINDLGNDYDFRVESDTSPGVFGTDGAGAGFAYFAPDPNGARMQVKCVSTTVTAAVGATVTATNLIPAGAKFWGVTTRITTELGNSTGTTGYTVGDGTDPDRWGTAGAITAGTTTSTPTAEPSGFTAAAANVVLTATGGNFDGTGVVRITVHYTDFAGPTS